VASGGGSGVGERGSPGERRQPWRAATALASDHEDPLPALLPEPAGLHGTERTSGEFDRAEAPERVAVRRQRLGFRSPLPYFHNGFAADLDAVVDFYDTRFHIGFTKQEKSDLVAFLRSL
jgi:cytochrome c peroxidase